MTDHPETVLLSERLDRVLGSTGTALREMRRDAKNRDKWSTGLAGILVDKLGRHEKQFMFTACAKAIDDATLVQCLTDILTSDIAAGAVMTQALVDLGWTPPKERKNAS